MGTRCLSKICTHSMNRCEAVVVSKLAEFLRLRGAHHLIVRLCVHDVDDPHNRVDGGLKSVTGEIGWVTFADGRNDVIEPMSDEKKLGIIYVSNCAERSLSVFHKKEITQIHPDLSLHTRVVSSCGGVDIKIFGSREGFEEPESEDVGEEPGFELEGFKDNGVTEEDGVAGTI